ncbi:MAG: T9SS type A sorting domain-containing protein [Calditrichaeota bacterium]|nr:T9SS type A sorting domain-containing protein [Calditrichota bacterium]
MKRLASLFVGMFLLCAGFLLPRTVQATTYTIDSLYVYGSGGRTDQSIDASETITVVCRIASGAWNTTTPVNSFYIVPNGTNPPTLGGADGGGATEYNNADISSVSFSETNKKLSFAITAPIWTAGQNSFTVFMDGKASGFGNYINTAETMVAAGGATTLLNVNPGSGTGFGYGIPVIDTTPPTMVAANTFATALDSLQVVFDETVTEVGGDCGAAFELTGDGIGATIFGTDMTLVSGNTWMVALDGNLPDRDWQGTVTYNQANSVNQLEDASGNEVANGHNIATTKEEIPPADPVLTTPAITTDLSGGTVNWTGTADAGATDASLASLRLQGSNDDVTFVSVGSTDSNTGDTDYTGSYTLGTQYAYYRLVATDDQGIAAYSASVGSFQAKQRLVFSGDTSEPVNEDEDQITVSIHDAYGNLEVATHTVSLSRVSGTGDITFRATQGGGSIGINNATIDISAASSQTFYYESDATGAHSLRAGTAGLVADTLAVTIAAGAASQILVQLPGQSFVDGTGITGTASAQTAGSSFNAVFYITDSANYVVATEDGARDLDFSSTASASPLGDNPTINGVESGSWNNVSISFTDGVSVNVPVVFVNSSETPTLSAGDNSGSPNLSPVASAAVSVAHGTADNLVFSITDSGQESNVNWTGTNTVTVQDSWGNTATSFDASVTPLTVVATPSAGVTINVGGRGDAILDLNTDFVSGIADLTSIGIKLTGSSNTYTINATSTLAENVANITDTVTIAVNAPTVSGPFPARLTHINAQVGNPGIFLLADIDENNESLHIVWGFDNDSTTAAYDLAIRDSAAVISGTGTVDKFVSSTTLDNGAAYDYMLWWVSGTDAQGNPVDGYPIYTSPLVTLVNPTLTVLGTDVGSNMLPNSTSNLITRLDLTSEMVGATIRVTEIGFSKTGTSNATNTHISNFKLWADDGNGTWNGSGTETLLKTVSGTVNPTFSALTLDVTNTGVNGPTVLWLTVDLSAAASVNQTLGMEITSASRVLVQNTNDNVVGDSGVFPQPSGTNDYTLPVEISLFEGTPDFGSNRLHWRTDSEENNLGFRVWRAPSEALGVVPPASRFVALGDWNTVNTLLGRDTYNGTTQYRFVDEQVEAGGLYCYKLESVDLDGTSNFYDLTVHIKSLEQPTDFALGENYPNPFNPSTSFDVVLPEDSIVDLKIYNLQGQLVTTLSSGSELRWGRHSFQWDGTNAQGLQVSSGVYILSMKAGDFEDSHKMMLLK